LLPSNKIPLSFDIPDKICQFYAAIFESVEAHIQTILFWLFSIAGIAGGVGLLINKNAVMAALSLILNFFCIAGLYLTLAAEFIAVIQILVYAGAIMVLFLFVIMLLNLQDEHGVFKFDIKRGAAYILGLAFIGEMFYVLRNFMGDTRTSGDFAFGKAEPIGQQLMTNYLFPFEIISVILIIALMGAIVVARKHNYKED
jgi:NADH-quinone oxidoreductase subunit J